MNHTRKSKFTYHGAREAQAVDNFAWRVAVGSGAGEDAASGAAVRVLGSASRAEVRRDSLRADAAILRDRGDSLEEVARALRISRRTLNGWGIK